MRYLDHRGFAALLAAIVRQGYDLYGPTRKDETLVLRRLAADDRPPEVAWNEYRLSESHKAFWFQPSKILVRSSPEAGPVDASLAPPRALVGLKACDLEALACIDRVFRDHEYQQPAYCAARERNLVISGDCTAHADTCFCTMAGGQPHPTRLFDLNLSPAEGGYLVEVGSARGEALVAEQAALFLEPRPGMLAERDRRRESVRAAVGRLNERFPTRDPFEKSVEKNLKTRIWGDLAATCVECNACNLACPTCHCFLLKDVPDGLGSARASLWDSCFHAGYARMAGGGTPRLQLTERFKNHYFHKFVAFPRNWGITACSGCGRCVEACLGRIDNRECLHRLETQWIPSEMVGDIG